MSPTPRPGAAAEASRAGLAWQDDAACKDEDAELFFAPEAESVTARQRREARARRICSGCPVRAQCGRFAAATGQRWGIWAGEDRELTHPAAPETPVLCGNGLHLMTAGNSKPVPGAAQVRCRDCQRESDRRTGPARRARNAKARNAADRARYAKRSRRQEEEKAA